MSIVIQGRQSEQPPSAALAAGVRRLDAGLLAAATALTDEKYLDQARE
ncbi:hypothetical protein ABT297_15240 [Dactylosporangium sp. NPDC000555]